MYILIKSYLFNDGIYTSNEYINVNIHVHKCKSLRKILKLTAYRQSIQCCTMYIMRTTGQSLMYLSCTYYLKTQSLCMVGSSQHLGACPSKVCHACMLLKMCH